MFQSLVVKRKDVLWVWKSLIYQLLLKLCPSIGFTRPGQRRQNQCFRYLSSDLQHPVVKREPCIENSQQHQGLRLTLLVPVTIAYVIGIRSLPLPKFFSLLKCLKLQRASSYFAFPRTILGLIYLSFLVARLSGTWLLMNTVKKKSNLQFSGRTFIYKQSVGDLTLNMLSFLKHGRFSITSIRKLLIGGFRKSKIAATQTPELGKTVWWDLFQASFLTREADNPMTGSDFDWVVSNHAVWGWKAPVKASVLLQLSPFFASIFLLFPQKHLTLRLKFSCYKEQFHYCIVQN